MTPTRLVITITPEITGKYCIEFEMLDLWTDEVAAAWGYVHQEPYAVLGRVKRELCEHQVLQAAAHRAGIT